MILPLLTSALLCATDAGVTVAPSWSRQSEPVTPGSAVKVERQTLTLAITDPTLGALTRSFEQVTLNLPDGGTTPALESFTKTLNLAAMQGEALVVDEQVASAKSDPSQGQLSARVRVVTNRAPFLVTSVCTDFQGPYPSTECQQQRFRVDTGASFTWFSAVPKNKQSALLALCTRQLKESQKKFSAEQKAFIAEGDEWGRQLAVSKCTEALINTASLNDRGDLVITIGAGLPHVVQAFAFDVTLPRADLQQLADPKGPLASR